MDSKRAENLFYGSAFTVIGLSLLGLFIIIFHGVVSAITEDNTREDISRDAGRTAAVAYNLRLAEDCHSAVTHVDSTEYDLVAWVDGCKRQMMGR